MRRLLKFILAFLPIFIVLTIPIKVKSHTSEEDAIKLSISNFFIYYFGAYDNYDNSSAVNIARGNDSLYLFQKAHEIEIKYLKEFNLRYRDIKYKIEYANINLNGLKASVGTVVDMCFKYDNLRKIESGIYNVNYRFALVKESGIWRIQEVESDYEKYRAFVEDVNKVQLTAYQKGYRSGLTKCQAADRVFNDHLQYIYRGKVSRSNNKAIRINDRKQKERGMSYEGDLETNSYYIESGVEYALRFAEAPLSERFFYTASSDCTNFVSQCVWAAYGGYVAGDDLQVQKNIRNKFKMTAQWFGNSGGGTPPWESVDRFFLYMKNSKVRAYNENSTALELDPDSIKAGDVLQFRRTPSGPYTHSVYVTENLGTGEFSGIFVCQHSTDWKNRNLEDLILSPGWGGYERCYIKHLSYSESHKSKVDFEDKSYVSSYRRNVDISKEDIEEGKKVVEEFYKSINSKDFDGYLRTLGSYRRMKNGENFDEFFENKRRFKVKEISFPGKFHDMREAPHSYKETFSREPYQWMYIYVVVEEDGLGREEEADFILIRESKDSEWKIHDVGV